ncbi:hypothetical protein IJ818_01635 [bacterium]|nr:hypothetical protein [bacterium]
MTIIRRLSFLDGSKLKKMIAFLGNDEAERFIKVIMNNSGAFIHQFLPLKYKFLPESFVLEEEKEIHGVITVTPAVGNSYKLAITRLMFEKNYFEVGKQLIDYTISKYGSKGADTFIVSIDDTHDELLKLFMDGCNFRQCGSEVLYRMPKKAHRINRNENIIFRPFKNSDAETVCNMYNNSVINHFRPSLLKHKNEFKDILFCGLSNNYELKYLMEDLKSKLSLAYFSIITFDNINYTVDIVVQEGYDIDYSLIFGFINREIRRRKKEFTIFVKVKKYIKDYARLEEYLAKKECTAIRNQLILVRDFYKLVKEKSKNTGLVVFNETNKTISTNFKIN